MIKRRGAMASKGTRYAGKPTAAAPRPHCPPDDPCPTCEHALLIRAGLRHGPGDVHDWELEGEL
jgi:hypothetical protein